MKVYTEVSLDFLKTLCFHQCLVNSSSRKWKKKSYYFLRFTIVVDLVFQINHGQRYKKGNSHSSTQVSN